MASAKITVVKDTWTALSSAGQEGKVTIKTHVDGGSLFIDHSDSGAGALDLGKAINSRSLIEVNGLYYIDLKPDNDSDIYYIYSDVAGFEVIADFRDAPATSGESEITDGDAATGGSSKATLIAAIVNALGNEALDDGEAGALAMDAFRGLWLATADRIATADRKVDIQPPWLRFGDDGIKLEQSAIDDGTETAYLSLRGARYLSIQTNSVSIGAGGSIKVYASVGQESLSLQDASRVWSEITNAWFGSTDLKSDGVYTTAFPVRVFGVKVVVVGAAGAGANTYNVYSTEGY